MCSFFIWPLYHAQEKLFLHYCMDSTPCPDLISDDGFFHLQRFPRNILRDDYRPEGKDYVFCKALSYALAVNYARYEMFCYSCLG